MALLAPPELRAQPRPPDDGRAPVEWSSHECRSLQRAIDAWPDSRRWIETRPLEVPESLIVRVPRIVTGGTGSRELRGTSSREVHAISADLQASPEPASVALSIAPPLWREWWWLPTGVVMLGVLGAYALHRVRLARLLELEKIRTRIATDLHDDIGSSLFADLDPEPARTPPQSGERPETAPDTLDRITALSRASSSIR